MMNLIDKHLTINPFSRTGRKRTDTKAVILHYVGINNQRAETVWNFFEKICPRDKHFSSTQYIIDLNGDVIRTMPDNEVAFHCGSREYTSWGREKFRQYASDPTKNSPNNCTIGIELCVDRQGNFTNETLNAAVKLVAYLLQENNLTTEEIGHHKMVVGWKDCPLPWIRNPELFENFKQKVREEMRVLI
jgi:N-acetylmuramoyl-L-alanine amidase